MSRIGKKPIKLNNAKLEIAPGSRFGGQLVKVNGSKGTLEVHMRPEVKLAQENDEVTLSLVEPVKNTKKASALWGLYRSLVANAIEGVNQGFIKELEIVGIGYKVDKQGNSLKFNIGYNNLINFDIPETINVDVRDGVFIKISGSDKQLVGETAAAIRRLKSPEPYKGKGIRYVGEVIKLKQGKSAS